MYNTMTIYTLSLNSSARITGTTITSAKYNFDWGMFPDMGTKYKMSWTMVTDTLNIASYSSICAVNITLSQSNGYKVGVINNGSITNNVGYLVPYSLGTSSFLFADNHTNNPIWIKHRPQNNQFSVDMISLTTLLPWVDNVGAVPANYILTMTFETEEYDNKYIN